MAFKGFFYDSTFLRNGFDMSRPGCYDLFMHGGNDEVKNNTRRFSNRVENYSKYRPRYPQGVFDTLKANCQLSETSIIADIGSGAGILAKGFLRLGCLVYSVEPNQQMREAGGQSFDFEGLKGRLLSSSYSPEAGQPGHDQMLVDLRKILDAH